MSRFSMRPPFSHILQEISYVLPRSPLAMVHHLPNAQNVLVERFRNRGETEAYLRSLQRLLPQVEHSLVFDPDLDSNNPANCLNSEQTLCNVTVLKLNPIDLNH